MPSPLLSVTGIEVAPDTPTTCRQQVVDTVVGDDDLGHVRHGVDDDAEVRDDAPLDQIAEAAVAGGDMALHFTEGIGQRRAAGGDRESAPVLRRRYSPLRRRQAGGRPDEPVNMPACDPVLADHVRNGPVDGKDDEITDQFSLIPLCDSDRHAAMG